MLNRRELLAAAALAASPLVQTLLADDKRSFRVGACDWSIGKRQDVGAFALGKQIGLDGVQYSFDNKNAPGDLRDPAERQKVLEASKSTGVDIASLGMGVLNNVPLATSDEAEGWVRDCIETMPLVNQHIVLLAFFHHGDINGKPELQAKLIERLKRLAPLAEKHEVVLGLESWMSAADTVRIMEAVGSPAVKMWYDTANSEKMGYDIYSEIRWLGRDRICQFHMKENSSLLGKGRVNFEKVRDAIGDIGYEGWVVIEAATEKGTPLVDCYVHNQKFLRTLFPA
jgi:sugar phosphate isomerase/epimerase